MIAVVVASVAYSLFPIFARWADQGGASALDVLLWRFVIATPLTLGLATLLRRRASTSPPTPFDPRTTIALLASGVLFAVVVLFAVLAVEHLPAGIENVCFYSYPALVALAGRLLGHQLPKGTLVALVLTGAGIALSVPRGAAATQAEPIGWVYLAVNVSAYVAYILIIGHLLRDRHEPSELVQATGLTLIGSLAVGLAFAAAGATHVPPTTKAWAALVGMALVSTVVATSAYAAGIAILGPPEATLIATIEPVFTVAWAAILLGESMSPVQLVGAALVVTGVVWLQTRR